MNKKDIFSKAKALIITTIMLFSPIIAVVSLSGCKLTKTHVQKESNTTTKSSDNNFYSDFQNMITTYGLTDMSIKGTSNSEPITNRIILSNITEEINPVSDYGAKAYAHYPDGTYILQYDNSVSCDLAFEILINKYGEANVEYDKIISMSRVDEYELNYGSANIGSATFKDFMSDSQLKTKVVVAVIDTGVSTFHEYLSSYLINGASMINSNYEDQNGHGSHVSGIIVDNIEGTAIKIMPVQVLDSSGNGSMATVAAGINWAVANGANIINLSLGGYDYSSSHYLDSAVKNAIASNVTVVAAAGNDSTNNDYFCPAHIKGVICVSAVDEYNNIPYFSNYGSNVCLAAPGVDIYSSIPGGYSYMSGTSMASPHVAAAAALIKASGLASTPSQIANILEEYSIDCGTQGWDQYYGYGVVDISQIDPQGNSIPEIPIETTPAPTEAPTTVAPTQPITVAPTMPPTVAPTEPVTEAPTLPPTIAPTEPVTEAPTIPPTVAPTEPVTVAPTMPPTVAPTQPVTNPPVYDNNGSSISVSVSTSNSNGVSTVVFKITTNGNINNMTILIDNKDCKQHIVSESNNNYHIDTSYLASGYHTYYISNGSSTSSGSFTK